MFVKAGAIIPMGPELRHVNEKLLSPLTLNLYPYGCPESRFSLYENDGISAKHLDGDFCITAVEIRDTGERISAVIHAREGKFAPPERACEVLRHGIADKPAAVSLNGRPLDSAHDSKTKILRVNFPDTGGRQELVVQRD